MLIDEFLPQFEESKSYSVIIQAPPDKVYEVLKKSNVADSWVIRFLFGLRSIPAILSGQHKFNDRQTVTIEDITQSGFMLLGEKPGQELVIGVVGKFWKMSGNICKDVLPEQFKKFSLPGFSKAVWNFYLESHGTSETDLSTETRIHCTDPNSAKKFKRYWTVIAPFSGLIRHEMLKIVKRESEKI